MWEIAGSSYKYKIEISTDNSTWTLVADKTANTSIVQIQTDSFAAVSARYVRITVTGLSANVYASFYEFEVYGGFAVETPGPTSAAVGVKGDANGSGSIDIVDALMVAQYFVGLIPTGFVAANADVNCDGVIDIVDALRIAQYYVGLLTAFC